METTVHVQVVLFASHREVFGESRVQFSVAPGTDLEALYTELVTRVPRMADLRSFTTFALNREVVGPSIVLHDGDEVALLQPVSGGCGD
jgi:molybdopterin converting factor small subunit